MAKSVDDVASELAEQVRALGGEVTEHVMANIDELVDAKVKAELSARNYQPLGGAVSRAFEGTKYARLGLSEIDAQYAHGILSAARQSGISKRGPSEELTNIVDAIHARVAADEGISQRAMDTADTTAVIGAQYMNQVWAVATQAAVVAPLIRSFAMTDATAYIPVYGAPPVPKLFSQSTQDNSADYDTVDSTYARISVTAPKYGIHQKWSGEIEEESIVPFVASLRERQQDSLAIYTDEMIVSGDTVIAATGNINSDDAQLAADDYRVGWDGLRKGAIIDNTGNLANAGAALTYAQLTNMRVLCIDSTRKVSFGHPANPADFVYLTSPWGEDKVANLDELITVDKYGPNATVLTGEVARIGRNPLLVTMAVPRTDADGKTSSTTAATPLDQVVAFNRNAYSLGYVRQMTVETYRLPQRDQNGIMLFWRVGMARYSGSGAVSGIESVAVLRNV